MKTTIKQAVLNYLHQTGDGNLYAADRKVEVEIFGKDVSVETVWHSKDEDKVYLHCGCKEFEGDIDIESLSDENAVRVLCGLFTGPYTHFTQKHMENAVMLAADLYQRMYNNPETDGGSLEVAGTIIKEAVNMERWLTEKYGKDDDCYLDRLEEYEALLVKKYELNEEDEK